LCIQCSKVDKHFHSCSILDWNGTRTWLMLLKCIKTLCYEIIMKVNRLYKWWTESTIGGTLHVILLVEWVSRYDTHTHWDTCRHDNQCLTHSKAISRIPQIYVYWRRIRGGGPMVWNILWSPPAIHLILSAPAAPTVVDLRHVLR
jgi:hypothetical protein